MATVLRPAPAPLAFRPMSCVPVRRPGSISAGSPAPIIHPVRMMPPSGASTPAPAPALVPEDTCPSCGNVFMPDAIFCRHCGYKREVEVQSVHSVNYNSVFSGPVSPSDGAAFDGEVPQPLYGVGISGLEARGTSPAATPVYSMEAGAVYGVGLAGNMTPTGPPPAYQVDPCRGLSGTVSPTPSGARVYQLDPLYGGVSGTITPTSGGAPVYHIDPMLYSGGLSGTVTPSPAPVRDAGTVSGTVTPTSGGAPVLNYPTGVANGRQPAPVMMEPSTLLGQYSAPSLPVGSCEVPATTPSTATAASAPRLSRLTSSRYSSTPAPIQVSPVPTQASLVNPSTGPRLSVAIPSVVTPSWTAPLQEKQVPEPQVPPSLTAGLPDPTSIERQKNAYARGLEEQLRHGTDVLAQQLKQQSDYLFAMGDQRKRQFALQVDQEIKQREMELAQQHNEQLLLLQQAAQQQKSALEHQANALLLEYNQKKAQEDLSYQQYQFQKKQYETQLQYNEEMKELQVQQSAAQQQVAHQRACIAQQAAQATQQAEATARQVRSTQSGTPPFPGAASVATLYPVPQTFATP
eukprot:symbB.v1.2.025979.t1/scaffold2560.1/size76387/11